MNVVVSVTLLGLWLPAGVFSYAAPCHAPPTMEDDEFLHWKIDDFDKYEGVNLEVSYKNGTLKAGCVYDSWVVNDATHISAQSSPTKGGPVDWRVTLVRTGPTEFTFENRPSTKEWVVGFKPDTLLVMVKCVRPDLIQAYMTSTDKATTKDFLTAQHYLNTMFPAQLKNLKIDFAKCTATN